MTLASRLSFQKRPLCAIATALLWWLSLQQLGLFALGWIALAPVLWACSELISPRARFFYGWRAGFLCFALHNWWLLPTITKASVVIGVPSTGGALLGVLAVAIIALGHGLIVGIAALVWNPRARIFQKSPLLLPLVLALLWLALEWARCQGELAHSWGALAYSQWRDTALLQSASLISQHGLSALCVWMAASIALWLRPEYSARVSSLWRVPVAVFALLHFWGAWRIWNYDQKPHRSMRVLLIQTNVSSLARNDGTGESQFDQAERLAREYSRNSRGIDLVLWPETSATVREENTDATSPQFFDAGNTRHVSRAKQLAADIQAGVLLGAQSYELSQSNKMSSVRNRAILFGKNGEQSSSAKTHVVPFGERAPFSQISSLRWLAQLAPSPFVEPAVSARPLIVEVENQPLPIGTLICFESCFVSPARELKNQGARMLFVLTNDEWFSGTNAPWEHAAMSTLRATESGVAVVQSANGGYSYVIDGRGRFLLRSEFGKAQAMEYAVPFS